MYAYEQKKTNTQKRKENNWNEEGLWRKGGKGKTKNVHPRKLYAKKTEGNETWGKQRRLENK